MIKKKSYLLVILTICFFSNLTVLSTNISNKNENEKDLRPRASASYTAELNYNKSKSYLFNADVGDRASWDFFTAPEVNITVMAMNESGYLNFNKSQYFTYLLLSNGNYSSMTGWFFPPTKGIWYIVFFHNDSYYKTTTTLSYNINEFYYYRNPILDFDDLVDNSDKTSSDPLINNFTFLVIIALIIAGTLIAIIYMRMKRKSLERLHSPPSTNEPPLEKRTP